MSKDKEDGIVFELEGKVWIVSTEKGVTTREELDGKTVLQCLISCLSQGLDLIGEKDESETVA